MINNGCLGSDFDDFLRNEEFIEDAEAVAAKRVIAFQIAEEMKKANITKTELAHRMHTRAPRKISAFQCFCGHEKAAIQAV
jgi:hypothetical protein